MPLRLYQAPLLTDLGIRHGFTLRAGGVSVGRFASLNLGGSWGDEPAHVVENLRRVAAAGGFQVADLCQVVQVHGARVLPLSAAERRVREADGMVTAAPLTLGVLSADCVGILLGDGRGRVAAVHAGWRGTVAGVAGEAVAALVRLGATPKDVRAALMPSIGPCCFAVGPEVADAFAHLDPESVHARAAQPHVNLWRANRAVLRAAGVRPAHIDEDPPCTHCDGGQFFSYRRDGAGIGQHLAFITGGQS